MKIAIHQPQYLPWLPYFLKIEDSDIFILLDSVEFQKNGLQNRNQIKSAQGAHWLTVPVKQQLGQKILDVKIDNKINWRRKHFQTIHHCYHKAASFKFYAPYLESLYEREWVNLNELNIELITMLMSWMNIHTPILRSSQMKAIGSSSDLVLNLCLEVGGSCYFSGLGGKNYLNQDAFQDAGLQIFYQDLKLPDAYPQMFPQVGFINHLSALDILFNCGESWRDYLPSWSGMK